MALKPTAKAEAWPVECSDTRLVAIDKQRTFAGVRSLRKVAGVVSVIGTALTQVSFSFGAMEGNAGMPKCFERRAAVGTGDRLGIDRLMAARAVGHRFSR